MTRKNNGRRLIFIGGAPRSGTTLVQNMLDCHPLILGGPEFLHLEKIVELRRKFHYSISIGYIDIICTQDDVDQYMSELIEKFLLPLADNNKCEFYSEKTPKNILIFSELMEMFPEAHFIMVIRDPRAIISSMKQVKKRAIEKGLKQPFFTKNIKSSIEYVKKCYETGFKAAKNDKEKILTVAYEKLLADPEGETKKITSYLGIQWDRKMLYPSDKKHLGEKAITQKSGEIWYNAKTYYKNPDKQNIHKWKANLTMSQKVKTTMAFQDNPEFLRTGYDFSLNSLGAESKNAVRAYYFYLYTAKSVSRVLKGIGRKIPGLSIAMKKLQTVGRHL